MRTERFSREETSAELLVHLLSSALPRAWMGLVEITRWVLGATSFGQRLYNGSRIASC